MARAQNSPRGLFAKDRVDVGAQQLTDGTTYLNLNNGVRISGAAGGLLTAAASYLNVPVGIRIGGAAGGLLTATAALLNVPAALQLTATAVNSTARIGPGAMRFVSQSTGKMIMLNTTGTTWTYLNVTSVLA